MPAMRLFAHPLFARHIYLLAPVASFLLIGALFVFVFVPRILFFIRIFDGRHSGISISQEKAFADYGNLTNDPRPQVVPKIIHHIYHNWQDPGNETLPRDWAYLLQTCVELNPGWEHKVRSLINGKKASRRDESGKC